MSFSEWKSKVQSLLVSQTGLGLDDLADVNLRDFHGDELSPEEAVIETLREQDFFPEDLLVQIADRLGVEL